MLPPWSGTAFGSRPRAPGRAWRPRRGRWATPVRAFSAASRRCGVGLVVFAVWLGTLAGCGHSANPNKVLGVWKVTYGAPSEVTIKATGDHAYAMTAKTPVTVVQSTCRLPVGTTIARFSGKGPSYSGQHGLWNTQSCAFAQETTLGLKLTGTDTAIETIGNADTRTLTKVSTPAAANNDAWLWLLLVLLVAVIAYLAVRRKRQQAKGHAALAA
jgi:hypothetical protein